MDCQVDLHMRCGHDSLLTCDAVIQRFIPIFLFTQCVHRMIVLTTTLAQGKMSCAFVFFSHVENVSNSCQECVKDTLGTPARF